MGPEGEPTGERRDEIGDTRESHETIETPEQESHAPLDAVMVFGIGPVQPQGMIGHEGKGHKYQLVPEAKLNAIAAATLYLEGKTRKIIFSGGETGKMELGEGVEPHPYPRSEGQMMAKYVMDKFGIPQEAIIVEDKAANTIENIARSLTPIDRNPQDYAGGLGYVGSAHHVDRIAKMVELFGLEGPTMSSAAVLEASRVRAEAGAPENKRVHRNLSHYRAYFEKTLDPDKNPTYRERLMAEGRWSYGLGNNPSYFLPQVRFIEDETRLTSVLGAERLADYLAGQGINIDTSNADELRSKLAAIKREIPDQSHERMPDMLPQWKAEERSEAERGLALPLREKYQHLDLAIFSDVDGTLNKGGEYTLGSRETIHAAEQANSVIILCSSREGPNLVDIQKELEITPDSPIIIENGGGIYFPKGVLTEEEIRSSVAQAISEHFEVIDQERYWLIELAQPKEELLAAFEEIKPLFPGEVKFVQNMNPEEVAALYHVSAKSAENILRENKRYMYNFAVAGEVSDEQEQKIKEEAEKRGLHITRAVSWHLMSAGRHKGEAVRVTSHLIRKLSQKITTIAMGDAQNDLEMFAQCDIAYNVGEKDLRHNLKVTAQKGPDGWVEAITAELLSRVIKK